MKLAINGLGRLGRLALRHCLAEEGLEVVAVAEPADPRVLAHLLNHDSVYGQADFDVAHEPEALRLGGRRIPVFPHWEPERLPFGRLGAEVVLECTGRLDARSAAGHLREGARRVILALPAEDADTTLIPGVNLEALALHRGGVISAGSAATHCLGLLVKVLDDAFGLDYGLMTDVCSYGGDQNILDLPHPDLRRARAASMSMIPVDSEAPRTLGQALPHLQGRLDGLAVRVPTPAGNLADLTALLRHPASREDINRAFATAAHGALKPYLEVLDEELVSPDLVGRQASCLFDPFLTKVADGAMVKVFGWYDGDWAFAARLKELALLAGVSR